MGTQRLYRTGRKEREGGEGASRGGAEGAGAMRGPLKAHKWREGNARASRGGAGKCEGLTHSHRGHRVNADGSCIHPCPSMVQTHPAFICAHQRPSASICGKKEKAPWRPALPPHQLAMLVSIEEVAHQPHHQPDPEPRPVAHRHTCKQVAAADQPSTGINDHSRRKL